MLVDPHTYGSLFYMLLAMATLPDPDPVPTVTYQSGGRLLIIGPLVNGGVSLEAAGVGKVARYAGTAVLYGTLPFDAGVPTAPSVPRENPGT